jgi:ABC-type oligopeptide transport system substrate-binding subunit
MDVQIRALADFVRLARRGEPFDIAVVGWQSDYPDPLDFLHLLDGRTIGPDGTFNFAYYDDAGYNRRLDAAAGPMDRTRPRDLATAPLWRIPPTLRPQPMDRGAGTVR